jgi:hypothetical protein
MVLRSDKEKEWGYIWDMFRLNSFIIISIFESVSTE